MVLEIGKGRDELRREKHWPEWPLAQLPKISKRKTGNRIL